MFLTHKHFYFLIFQNISIKVYFLSHFFFPTNKDRVTGVDTFHYCLCSEQVQSEEMNEKKRRI